jgi:hypothetical protein
VTFSQLENVWQKSGEVPLNLRIHLKGFLGEV